MRARFKILRWFSILRKHALVVLSVMIVVGVAGVVYVSRQTPVYRASAKLLIERRSKSKEVSEAVALNDDSLFFNTQYWLIRNDRKLASSVLTALGDDPIRQELDVETLLAGIKPEPLPGTLIVNLAFEGASPEIAMTVAELYADSYVKRARQSRADTLEIEIEDLQSELKAAREVRAAAEKTLREHEKAHADISFVTPSNRHEAKAENLDRRVTAAEVDLIEMRKLEREVLDTLASAGITVDRVDSGQRTLLPPEEVPLSEFDDFLRQDVTLLALPAVADSDNIKAMRTKDRTMFEELAELELKYKPHESFFRTKTEVYQAHLRTLGREVRNAIERFLRQIDDHKASLDEFRAEFESAAKLARATNEAHNLHNQLQRELDAASVEYTRIDERLQAMKKVRDAEGPRDALETFRVVGRPRDSYLIRPQKGLIYFLTALTALFLGAGAAALLEFVDDTIKSREDFDRLIDAPFIGFVPRTSPKEHPNPDLVARDAPHSAVAEAYRSIRTSIQFAKSGREIKTLVVSSASPNEGKTTVSVNLAVTMARAAGRVLLIDADLRRTRVHEALGVENDFGLTNVLIGKLSVADAISPTGVENLDVMLAGPTPPNPSELLGSPAMRGLIEEASKHYSKIVIDTPPLVAVTDACVLGPLVDGVILVVSVGKTSWRLINRAIESLRRVEAPLRGAILNSVASSGRSYYGYGQSYSYTPKAGAKGNASRKQKKIEDVA